MPKVKRRKRGEQQDKERDTERESKKRGRVDECMPEGSYETHGGGFLEKTGESDEKRESWRIPDTGRVLTLFCVTELHRRG